MQAVVKGNLRSQLELTSNSDDAGENNVSLEFHNIQPDCVKKSN